MAVLTTRSVLSEDLNHELATKYSNKMFVLRNFYSGTRLTFDINGQILGNAPHGDWTADGVIEIRKLKVVEHSLQIQANRVVAFTQDKAGFQLKRSGQSLKLEISAGADLPTEPQIDAALSRILLNDHDDFSSLVPEFWKTCVQLAVARLNNIKLLKCRFADDLLALVGANPPSAALAEQNARLVTGDVSDPDIQVYRVGSGVSPPAAIFRDNPGFTDAARSADIQGTLTLGLVVDKSGLPQDIQVVEPLGAGLDAAAAAMVQKWKFKPSEKNGQPVATRIQVEVEFRRYN